LYFFIGGTAGMSAVLALGGLVSSQPFEFVRAALAVSVAGALISPCLLIWDLGRPSRFLNMLRVFKWRSAMSMGVWTLVAFSGFATVALLVAETSAMRGPSASPDSSHHLLLLVLSCGAALTGALLATYTGVLLGATVIPVWSSHHRLLPVHFGVIALGSAAAVLELLGFRLAPLNAIGLAVPAVETGIGAWIELNPLSRDSPALRAGAAGWLLRGSGLLTGPASLLIRLGGWTPVAATCFVAGAVLSRYGWLHAGRASALETGKVLVHTHK
jgi:hypothetical protein